MSESTSPTIARSAVTMADIARELGVTKITVSNALTGRGRVSESLRQRVVLLAEEMGYESNLLARSLATGRAEAIGVLAYNISSRLAAIQLAGVEAEAQSRGYGVVVAAHDHDPKRALAALRKMSERRLDGIISISSIAHMQPGVVEGLPQLKLPYVFSFHEPDGSQAATANCVTVDQVQGARLAVQHLWDRGRRRVGFLGGPLNRLVTQRRLEGYRQILQENGVSVREDWIQFGTDFYPVHGVDAARVLFSSCSPGDYPDALFCASDGLAAGALRVCRELRLRVPEDVAIIGFDDSPMCLATDPPLSSIRMPVQEVGRACVGLLIDRIEAPHTHNPENLRLPCSLVLREST